MEELSTDLLAEPIVEILLPEKEDEPQGECLTCLCCGRTRSRAWMDDDGCGICNECLEA